MNSRRVHHLCQELDCAALGRSASGARKDGGSRTLVTSYQHFGWNESQNQVCDVGFVLARSSLGVLLIQSDLVWNLVESGGRRGPSTGVRVSAKGRKPPLVLSPEQVKLSLAKLEFRDQLLVFLDGSFWNPPGRTRSAAMIVGM